MGRTATLRSEIKSRFYPYAEARGFSRDESDAPMAIHFRRLNDTTLHMFCLRWDKSGEPRFSLTFNDAPRSGVTIRGRLIPAESLHPQDPGFPLSLQRVRGPYMRSWFQLKKPLLQRLLSREREYSPSRVVDSLIEWFPEVEAWWQSRLIGPHVYAPLGPSGRRGGSAGV